jgi:ADP-ribosylglycohydrolase
MARTSATDPLQIGEVACAAGVIGMTFCPGKRGPSVFGESWERDLETDVRVINAWGADAVVTLMERDEFDLLQVADLGDVIESHGMAWHHLAVPDEDVPTATFERRWTYAGHVLRKTLKTGGRVLIHCRGGRGRTGLVAARLLVEFGHSPRKAIGEVRAARPGTIETKSQGDYVLNCAAVVQDEAHAERVLGCLFGGAVGDAFGYAVEFIRLAEIHRRYGERGLVEPVLFHGQLVVSDDTQMTLFTAEALAKALAAGACGDDQLRAGIRTAYLAWLQTQQGTGPHCPKPMDLRRYGELWKARAPGNTCLSALEAGGHGTMDRPINQSKGCGGVMRVAPIGLVRSFDAGRSFNVSAAAAALTHGHSSGYLSAAAMGSLVRELLEGETLDASLGATRHRLEEAPGHEETLRAIDSAVRLSAAGEGAHEAVKALGEGWVGEEALAIALFAALTTSTFRELLQVASNHDGDSDSTASIAGQIWGATNGLSGIPNEWIRRLDVFDPICDVATQLLRVPNDRS